GRVRDTLAEVVRPLRRHRRMRRGAGRRRPRSRRRGRGPTVGAHERGALADPVTRESLLAGPGRLRVTNGAIGGLDVLEAAAQADALETVEITTSKEATGLIRPWMTEAEAERLRRLRPEDGPLTVFTGNPAEAIEKFPANVNIAVALAWATRGL